MARYRSELDTLRMRITELEAELDEHDKLMRDGRHANADFKRVMFWLGRQVGKTIRFFRRRKHTQTIDAARARLLKLERRLEAIRRRVPDRTP